MLALIIQSNIHPLKKKIKKGKKNKTCYEEKKLVYNYTCLLIFKQ